MLKLFCRQQVHNRIPLNLKEFVKIRESIIDGEFGDQMEWTYRDNDKNKIAYVKFKPLTGQIGILDVDRQFQRRTLGKQIVEDVEIELKKNGIKKMWVACSKGHYYWSKFPGFEYQDNIHPSVNNCGYSKESIE